MSDDSGSSRRGPFPAMPALALMLIVSAVVFQIPPLKSSRPQHDSLPELGKGAGERVRARLWQDPLQAVYAEHEKRKKERSKGDLAEIKDKLGAINDSLAMSTRPGETEPDWRFHLKINRGTRDGTADPEFGGDDSGDRIADEPVDPKTPSPGDYWGDSRVAQSFLVAQIRNLWGTVRFDERKKIDDVMNALRIMKKIAESMTESIDLTTVETTGEEVGIRTILLLSVLLHGGPYPEDAENRMRTRYAVLSALGQAGYKPKHGEHLEYVDFRKLLCKACASREDRSELDAGDRFTQLCRDCEIAKPEPYAAGHGVSSIRGETRSGENTNEGKLDFLIPFERFGYTKIVPERASENFTPVYVVWIDEDALNDPDNFVHELDTEFAWRLSRILGMFEKWLSDGIQLRIISDLSRRIIEKATPRVLSEIQKLVPDNEWPMSKLTLESQIREDIFDRILTIPFAPTEYRVIGPVSSDSLLKMRSVRLPHPPTLLNGCKLPHLQVYSPWATVADQVLEAMDFARGGNSEAASPGIEYDPRECYEESPYFSLCRTTATDAELIRALLKELRIRDASPSRIPTSEEKVNIKGRSKFLNPPNHMVLIGEWDTLYGRARRCTLLNEIIEPERKEYICRDDPDYEKDPPNLHFINYLRGLDGRTPNENKTEELHSRDPKTDEAQVPGELPVGPAQVDYLRRLQQQLGKLQRDLSAKNEGELKAIGVIGSDVYDKLLILKALRPHFPRAVFFTTDLDAHMAHPSEYEHTRNLIVASPYGLTLHEDLQRGLPPFRDSYQTAMYLTTLYAIGDRVAAKCPGYPTIPPSPRVFEIGRSGAYDLWPSEREYNFGIHPQSDRDRNMEWWGINWWKVLLVPACLVALTFPLLAAFRPIGRDAKTLVNDLRTTASKVRKKGRERVVAVLFINISEFLASRVASRWLRVVVLFVFTAASSTALCFVTPPVFAWVYSRAEKLLQATSNRWSRIAEDFTNGHLEPFVMLEGISAWPTELIRAFVCILSLYFLHSMHQRLSSDGDDMEQRFFGQRQAKYDSSEIVLKWRTRYLLTDADVKCSNVEDLWKAYRKLGGLGNRFARAGFYTLVYMGFGWLLLMMLGFPNRPIRGVVCTWIDLLLLCSSVALLILLVFYVLDATRLCNLFIRRILDLQMIWPIKKESTPGNAEHLEQRSDLGLDNLRKIRLISERTKSVGSGVKYPFIVLFLIIFSGNRFFDNWDLPIGLILIFAFVFAAVLFCGWLLRRSAREAREVALDDVKAKRVKLLEECPPVSLEDERIKRLDDAIDQIDDVRTGAFSPVGESPILSAPLIPAGLYGLTELLARLSH